MNLIKTFERVKLGGLKMKAMQKWCCETGCGHTFLVDKDFKVHKPTCPNCKTKDRLVKKGMFQVELTEVRPFLQW